MWLGEVMYCKLYINWRYSVDVLWSWYTPSGKWQFNGGNDASPMDLGLPNFQSIPTGLQDQNFLGEQNATGVALAFVEDWMRCTHTFCSAGTATEHIQVQDILPHTHKSCLKDVLNSTHVQNKYPNWTVSNGCMEALNDSSLIQEILKLAIPRKSCKQC